MDNVLANQGNSLVPIVPGKIQDWNLTGIPLIVLPGNPIRSFIPGSPSNSLPDTEVISKGIYVYGGSTALDRTAFFYPNGIPALAIPTLTATAVDSDTIHLTSSVVTGADGYRFWQKANDIWTILQNTSAHEIDVNGLIPNTSYDFRVQAVGDGTNHSDSGFGLASATTAAGQTYIFRDTFTDTNKAYGSHQADAGSLTFELGSGEIESNRLRMTPDTPNSFARAVIGGNVAVNMEIGIDIDLTQISDSDHVDIELFQQGSNYGLVSFTRTSLTSGTLVTGNDLTPIIDSTNIAGIQNGAIRLLARRVGGVVTGTIASQSVTYTESRNITKVAKIQGNNGGLFDNLVVTLL